MRPQFTLLFFISFAAGSLAQSSMPILPYPEYNGFNNPAVAFSASFQRENVLFAGGGNYRRSEESLAGNNGDTHIFFASFDMQVAPNQPTLFSGWDAGIAFFKEKTPLVTLDGIYGKLRYDLLSLFRKKRNLLSYYASSFTVGANLGGVQHRLDFNALPDSLKGDFSTDKFFQFLPDWSLGIDAEVKFTKNLNLFGNLSIPPTLGIEKVYDEESSGLFPGAKFFGTAGARLLMPNRYHKMAYRPSAILPHIDMFTQLLLEVNGRLYPYFGAFYYTNVGENKFNAGGSYNIDNGIYYLSAGFSIAISANEELTIRATVNSRPHSSKPTAVNVGVIYSFVTFATTYRHLISPF